jgi:hypothetical protein
VFFVIGDGHRVGALFDPPDEGSAGGHSSHTLFLNFLDEIRRRATKAAVQ